MLKADKNLNCFDWLVNLVRQKKEESPFSIIFCHTISDIVLILSVLLRKLGTDAYLEGPEPAPERCLLGVYYSATPKSAKQRVCNSFTGSGKSRIAISSTSLSMGVDFPNVTYVIHFGPGRTLTDHLQQAGRAGRNSQPAHSIILYQGKHLSHCEQRMKNVVKKKIVSDNPYYATLQRTQRMCHLKLHFHMIAVTDVNRAVNAKENPALKSSCLKRLRLLRIFRECEM